MTTLAAIHAKMARAVADAGGHLDAVFFCPHAPLEGCDCRKPRPGMLVEIARRFEVDPASMTLVGDTLRDLQAAEAVGAQPVLVLTGKGRAALREGGLPATTRVRTDLEAAVRDLVA
jgi:D-glycero-D-manno-heptose 1,7-bisphosphate phosphatase